ncbi:MAG: hypothetical protein RLZZ588_767, partial [Chloroflexota bacterium]
MLKFEWRTLKPNWIGAPLKHEHWPFSVQHAQGTEAKHWVR